MFFDEIKSRKYASEIAQKYQKKLGQNEDKLFTFLNYDDVAWNNNNAENAIKAFAMYRKGVEGFMTEDGLTQYLKILGIQQTCKYRGINFLEFLKSGEISIEEYSQKH